MASNDSQRATAQTFDDLPTSEKVKLIQSQVIVAILENPPNGVEPGSYSAAKDFLKTTRKSACQELFEKHNPNPEYVTDDAMQLLALIRAYKLVGQEVPPVWVDLCRNQLKSVDKKWEMPDFSEDYDIYFTQNKPNTVLPLPSQAILETFTKGPDTADDAEDGNSRKRRRAETLQEEEPNSTEEVVSKNNFKRGADFYIRMDFDNDYNRPETIEIRTDRQTESFVIENEKDTRSLFELYLTFSRLNARSWRKICRDAERDVWFCFQCIPKQTYVEKGRCPIRVHKKLSIKFLDGEDGQVRPVLSGF
ncbi:hypothetical protein V8F20_002117 [Naviculisporaceae sp. PSN 640]